MAQDIVDLIDFYATSLGQTTATHIRAMLTDLWPNHSSDTYLSIGYPLPFMPVMLENKPPQRTLVFMPAQQGIIHWPDESKNVCCLINEDSLPLPDESVDRILVIHSLEHAEHARPYLRELWRVLASNGRLVVVVPNRRGLWAQLDETPFGHGNPYTMTQLSRLLKENQFTPLRSLRGLYAIPSHSRILKNVSKILEKIAPALLSKFSGLVCIEASKQVYCGYQEKKSPLVLIRQLNYSRKVGSVVRHELSK